MPTPSAGGIWYFGKHAGINFNSTDANGNPTKLLNGGIFSEGGCAVISDPLGNVVFYSNGIDVYDGTDTLVNLGNPLKGGPSSAQSCIVLPSLNILTPDVYFIVTIDCITAGGGHNYGINYTKVTKTGGTVVLSLVNTAFPLQDNGFGDNPVEKITATKSADGTFYWLVTKTQSRTPNNVSKYIIYKFNDSGVLATSFFTGNSQKQSAQGYVKFNSSGNLLLCTQNLFATDGSIKTEVFDFDNSTGILSNERLISKSGISCVEISPDGLNIYFTVNNSTPDSQNGLWHCKVADLTTLTRIDRTSFIIPAGLQLGPDNAIYVAGVGDNNSPIAASSYNFLAVIKNPNDSTMPPTAASVGFTGVLLDVLGNGILNNELPGTKPVSSHNNLVLGRLPTFLNSVITPDPCAGFMAPTIVKSGDTLTVPDTFTTYQWYVDGILQPGATSHYFTPTISGAHVVTVTNDLSCTTSSEPFPVITGCTNPLAINYDPAANFDDGSCIVCNSFVLPIITKVGSALAVLNNYVSYQWKKDGVDIGGATTFTYVPAVDGSYTVFVTDDNGCSGTTVVYVVVFGCTNPNAINYNSSANFDDGTCKVFDTPPPLPVARILNCVPELTFLDKMKCCLAQMDERTIFLTNRGEDTKALGERLNQMQDAINILERYEENPTICFVGPALLKNNHKLLSSGGILLSLVSEIEIPVDPDTVNTVSEMQVELIKEFLLKNCSICNC